MAPNPLYSSYLDFAPTFKWGGRSYGAGDQAAFRKWLASRGQSYATWAQRNPRAARVFDPIEQQIYGAFQPQLSAIDRERQVQRDYYSRLMQNLGGFTAALGPLLSGVPGNIRGAYTTGADTMKSAGSGYGGLLNADQAANAAAQNATLEAIDSPARAAGGDAGGVLAGVAGWLPSEQLLATGSAWGDRAAHYPTEAALQADLMAKDLLRQAADTDKEFSGKITDVLSGLAGARAELASGSDKNRLAQQKQALSELKAERDWYLKQQALALAQGRADLAEQAAKRAEEANQRLKNASAGLDFWGNPRPGYRVNPNTGLVEKVNKPKTKTPKATDWGRIQKSIAGDASRFEEKITDVTDPRNTDPVNGTVIKWDYQRAFKALWTEYSGLVKNKGRLRKLINEILAANGIKKKKATNSGLYPGRT